jgi:hypothetical protein
MCKIYLVTLLGLLAEDLTLEPVKALLKCDVGFAQLLNFAFQLRVFPGECRV